MAAKAIAALSNIADYRRLRGESQAQFWSRFGVAQSGGSRYECGRAMPTTVAILVCLYYQGDISDGQLEEIIGKIRNGKKRGRLSSVGRSPAWPLISATSKLKQKIPMERR